MTPPSDDPDRHGAMLLGQSASDTAASSLASLMRAVTTERGTAVRSGGPTVEDLVREALRPMLGEWLDQHLPPIVERLVQAEIERVVARATA